jgi:hypothetical protein
MFARYLITFWLQIDARRDFAPYEAERVNSR